MANSKKNTSFRTIDQRTICQQWAIRNFSCSDILTIRWCYTKLFLVDRTTLKIEQPLSVYWRHTNSTIWQRFPQDVSLTDQLSVLLGFVQLTLLRILNSDEVMLQNNPMCIIFYAIITSKNIMQVEKRLWNTTIDSRIIFISRNPIEILAL